MLNLMAKTAVSSEVKRVGKFGVVGIINTLIDFAIYNLLSSRTALTLVQANIVSTSVAMVFSFFANKSLVFKNRKGNLAIQVLSFFIVTAFGLYILQTGVIKLLTEVWLGPVNLAVAIVHLVGLSKIFSDSFVIKNSAKVAATVVSLVWNYLLYKRVVFKG